MNIKDAKVGMRVRHFARGTVAWIISVPNANWGGQIPNRIGLRYASGRIGHVDPDNYDPYPVRPEEILRVTCDAFANYSYQPIDV